MRKKFKIMYPKDYHDQSKAGTEYKSNGMLAMNKDGVFFEIVDRGWEGWSVYKLSEILYSYDVVWED